MVPVYNPTIPYIGAIPGGVNPGKMITVEGFVPHHAQRFAINIQCGPGVNPRDDMALHVNVRFQEMCIVRNHLQSMSWGMEDIGGGMPLSVGNNFQAIILCEANAFKIAFNGSHFCEFPHRMPMQRASHITIDGDVNINSIQFQDSNPSFQPSGWSNQSPAMPSAPPQGGMYGPPPPYSEQQMFNAPPAAYSYAAPPAAGFPNMPPGYAPGYQPQMPAYVPGIAYAAPAQYERESSLGSKVLKYGLPIAGVGLGAYALGSVLSRSRSSSSSSDDCWFG